MSPLLVRVGWLLWAWLPVVVWTALILSMSGRSDLPLQTNPQTGETIRTTFATAKMAHVVEYSVLALLLLRALAGSRGGLRLSLVAAVAVTVVVAGLVGSLDEIRQSFVPNREPRLTDVALDTASALVASLAVVGWRRFRSRRAPDAPAEATSPGSGRRPAPLPRAGEGIGS